MIPPIRWAVALTVLLVGVFLNCLAQAVIDRYLPNYAPAHVLTDLGFTVLPAVPFTWGINITAGSMIAIVVVAFWVTHGRFFNASLYVFIQQLGTVFLLRAGSIVLTLLPTPLPGCVSTGLDQPVVLRALRIMLALDTTCADVFFSGHAATMTLALLAWHTFVEFPTLWRRTLLVLASTMTACFCLLLVASRFHYSVDVVYGILTAVVVWHGWSDFASTELRHHPPTFGSFFFSGR